MSPIVMILGALFLALVIIVPLVERFGKRHSDEELSKLTRYIFPLIGVLLVLQLLRYLFG